MHFNGSVGKRNKHRHADIFYANCIEEAIAHMLSRPCLPKEFGELDADEKTKNLFARHIEFERIFAKQDDDATVPVELLAEIAQAPVSTLSMLWHMLGYRLGDLLFQSYKAKKFSGGELESLLKARFSKRNPAFKAYMDLAGRFA